MQNTNQNETNWELKLGFLIHDVSRLRRSAFDRCAKPLNVTRSQWWVLAYLSRKDGITQSQLAEQLDLGKVAVGGLIDRLEKSGLVRRVPDEEDRRVNRIYLEDVSKDLIAKMRKVNLELNKQLLRGLSDSDLEAVTISMDKIKSNLRDFLNEA